MIIHGTWRGEGVFSILAVWKPNDGNIIKNDPKRHDHACLLVSGNVSLSSSSSGESVSRRPSADLSLIGRWVNGARGSGNVDRRMFL